MRPRILIMMHYMELGGAESALLGLLQSIDSERVDVDVFLYDHRGELMPYIPSDRVRLLPVQKSWQMIERPLTECVRVGQLGIALGRLWARWTVDKSPLLEGKDDIRIFSRVADCVEPFLSAINPNVEYDLAISFVMPHNYVLSKVKAKKTLGWIHTDYSRVCVDVRREAKVWANLDYVVSISEDVGEKFVEVFPSLRNRIVPIENILNAAFIHRRVEEEKVRLCEDASIITLLTIGRFSYQKKMEDIPAICRRVRKKGILVRWFIIGYGSKDIEQEVHENIVAENVVGEVVLLGKKNNPYPYIKACDVYVQPSRYEGKSITVREAQILGKPVAVTNYPTAASQIKDGLDGVIVPMEVEQCADALASFLRDVSKRQAIADYLQTHEYGNESEVEKIYKLVGA